MDAPHVIATLAAALLQTVGIRSATEQPRYTVVDRVGSVEVRRYDGRIAAEAHVAGDEERARNEGFRLVAGYIFGGNRSRASIAMTAPVAQAPAGERIAMTAPVAQAPADGAWMVQFTMPSGWTLDTLPVPSDPRVTLRPVPGGLVLARRYRGTWSEARFAEEAAALDAVRAREGLSARGAPTCARYDPPWTLPFLRRNEVLLAIAE